MKTESILNAVVVSGTYDGKPYKGGRLLVGTFGDKTLSFCKLYKCTVELAESLQKGVLPLHNVQLLYDKYQNVVSCQKERG